jgi:hypothetical protein
MKIKIEDGGAHHSKEMQILYFMDISNYEIKN